MAHAEKRGYDKRAKKWRWRGRYKLPNGKWGSVSKDEHGQPFYSERAAEEYAHGLEVDVRRRQFVNPRDGRVTVGEWADMWLESIDVAPLTERDYRNRIRSQILPEWEHTAVGDLTPVGIATWEKRLRARFSKNYVDGIVSVFRTMLDDAVASKVRGDNPVPTRMAGRRGRYQKQAKEEAVIATPRQILLVARNALDLRGLTGFVMVLTIAYAGLRIGEAASLTRDRLVLPGRRRDVEVPEQLLAPGVVRPDVRRWEELPGGARILLAQQSQYVDGKPTLVGPKYGSDRGVIIPPFLAEFLQQLLDSHESEFVFTAPKGGRLLIGGDFYADTWRPLVAGRPPRRAVRGHAPRPGMRPVLGLEEMVPHGGLRQHEGVAGRGWAPEGGGGGADGAHPAGGGGHLLAHHAGDGVEDRGDASDVVGGVAAAGGRPARVRAGAGRGSRRQLISHLSPMAFSRSSDGMPGALPPQRGRGLLGC
ncbi:hypothetical protein LUW77_03120 [Streptomyces radiopugnans]|nr:hypothetical protein LUW77_03120 [Streptomyces radiopugnans]